MSLKNVIANYNDKKKEAGSLSKYKNLVSAIKSWMNVWPPQSTYTDHLRASQLYFVCPRGFVLNYWNPTDNRNFSMASRLFMTTGTHLHGYLQNNVLGPMGILRGSWRNTATGEILAGFHPDPEKAVYNIVHQKPSLWEFEEERFFDSAYRIGGHIDGQIDLDRIDHLHKNTHRSKIDPQGMMKELRDLNSCDNIVNLEIKTCGNYPFENLIDSNSLPEYYKMQAEIYQHMTGKDKTVFWYINRNSMESKLILYENTTRWWSDAKRKAKSIWQAIKDETLPISGMLCVTPKDKRAKECAFRTPCFDEMDFKKYVRDGKERAAREGRRFLDLAGTSFD